MTAYQNLVVDISRSFSDMLDKRYDGAMDINARHEVFRLLTDEMTKAVDALNVMDLASILTTIPDLEALEVGEEFYGAPAVMLIRAVVQSALLQTFSHVFTAINTEHPNMERVHAAICWRNP